MALNKFSCIHFTEFAVNIVILVNNLPNFEPPIDKSYSFLKMVTANINIVELALPIPINGFGSAEKKEQTTLAYITIPKDSLRTSYLPKCTQTMVTIFS